MTTTIPETVEIQPWRKLLYELMLTGAEPAIAAASCDASAEWIDVARREAVELAQQPFFRIAREHGIRLRAREWLLAVHARLAESTEGGSHVTSLFDLTLERFMTEFYFRNRALVLPGIAKAWPAISKWTPDYLKGACGAMTVEVMMHRSAAGAGELNTAKRLPTRLPWHDYVDLVFSGVSSNDYYLNSRNQFFENVDSRGLLEDLGALPFVETRQYSKAKIHMFFGPGGTVTPLHHDDRNNTIVQILGRKRVRLYAPCYSEMMAQSQMWFAAVDPETTPLGGHATKRRAVPTILELGPGDALFIPVGWWHHVEALEPSITLSFIDFGVPNQYDSWQTV